MARVLTDGSPIFNFSKLEIVMTSFFKKQTWISVLNILLLLFCAAGLFANNIQIGAPTLTGENRTEGYVFVTFDLSWENSWRGTEANNWDAAWVFVKFRIGGGEWQHAKLHNTGHLPGTGTPATISAGLINENIPFEPSGNPAVGAFIYRSGDGFGTFNTTANKLRWNYAAHGITNATSLEVNVFAIEMVYVPEGEFNVGGGSVGGDAFISTTINTGDAKVAPSGTGSLGGQAGGYPTGQTPPTYSTWPNGFNAFYCMKYEITQQQYVDFLNNLTINQSINRIDYSVFYGYGNYGNRYAVIRNYNGEFSTSNPDLPCSMLTIMDGASYSEWAGLRPMTDMEYEKASRGNKLPELNEYAWGNDQIINQSFTLENFNQSNEGISLNYSASAGNANYFGPHFQNGSSFYGPFRVGIFAANGSNSGRVSSGASFFGIMELTGNLLETFLSISDPYDGKHGIGSLDSNGNPTSFSPDKLVFKGGGFVHSPWVVSRRDVYPIQNWYRETGMGFRAARSE